MNINDVIKTKMIAVNHASKYSNDVITIEEILKTIDIANAHIMKKTNDKEVKFGMIAAYLEFLTALASTKKIMNDKNGRNLVANKLIELSNLLKGE
ncbi:MAG TPA: hypothetical protein IAB27_05410 [Candidatus Coprosoma intestinipullorum]|uniref:Cell division protein ZapA n=1 Tax=Candidatus Coprosoma intestinipullorum TaxID=2840752 RepID=A0A9D0ZRF5_9FIRM|nr:hypothetical protein [Candidatus Coprosoma intestinipullorum]